jgi:hypothetical protein
MAFAQHQLPTPTQTPTNTDMMDEETQPSPSSFAYPHHSTTWTPVEGMTPISTNPSRKRSRDESAFDSADAEGSYFPSLQQQVNTPAPIPEEPIYGEGMVLLNPSTGLAISAESQTGTWYEEKVEKDALVKEVEAINTANQFRPKFPASRKSMRLSQSSIKTDFGSDMGQQTAPASPPKTANASSRPEVDEATIALGVGWTKMASEDENIQTAARGWARYLENHYARHVHGAEFLLKSSGLNAYLVGAHEGFYLFSENLLEGRLVARTWENCLTNLRSQPMAFEGEEVLRAKRTPGPEGKPSEQSHQSSTERIENWADYHRLHNANGEPGPALENGGMEID